MPAQLLCVAEHKPHMPVDGQALRFESSSGISEDLDRPRGGAHGTGTARTALGGFGARTVGSHRSRAPATRGRAVRGAPDSADRRPVALAPDLAPADHAPIGHRRRAVHSTTIAHDLLPRHPQPAAAVLTGSAGSAPWAPRAFAPRSDALDVWSGHPRGITQGPVAQAPHSRGDRDLCRGTDGPGVERIPRTQARTAAMAPCPWPADGPNPGTWRRMLAVGPVLVVAARMSAIVMMIRTGRTAGRAARFTYPVPVSLVCSPAAEAHAVAGPRRTPTSARLCRTPGAQWSRLRGIYPGHVPTSTCHH